MTEVEDVELFMIKNPPKTKSVFDQHREAIRILLDKGVSLSYICEYLQTRNKELAKKKKLALQQNLWRYTRTQKFVEYCRRQEGLQDSYPGSTAEQNRPDARATPVKPPAVVEKKSTKNPVIEKVKFEDLELGMVWEAVNEVRAEEKKPPIPIDEWGEYERLCKKYTAQLRLEYDGCATNIRCHQKFFDKVMKMKGEGKIS